ncbi:MAG: DUF4294 domain-containing protein [Bacteroidales bacterium]|jgi:hypothetical protein|nr:DUF4294 domain-containing protein [Bacteroidales bacterium]MCI2121975.1 DUF4294 domain-containing protein [Bacteroidales bacterium]MCI2146118.1 DUF4294 domain-containing protein [Bacteroidales bacterium]
MLFDRKIRSGKIFISYQYVSARKLQQIPRIPTDALKMNFLRKYVYPILIVVSGLTCQDLAAQNGGRIIRAPERSETSAIMNFIVVKGDTIYLDELPPAVISYRSHMSTREWRIYYKRVYNFSRAYPYALFVADVIQRTDSLFEADHYSKRQREKYLSLLKETLLKDFDKKFRGLTLKQGLMMIRLIDREVGMTPYIIIKKYLGGINATFWQGVARMFKGDLKKPYDKFGEDADLEELCKKWEKGEFRQLYVSIFGKLPLEISVPEKYMKPLR